MNTLYTYGKLFHEGGGAFNNAKTGQNTEPVVTPEHSEGQAGIAKAGVPLFTPGPWRLGHKVPSLIVQDTPDKCGVVICEVDPEEKPFAQTHANRLLIAAAPELYEALKETLDVIEGYMTDIYARENPGLSMVLPPWHRNGRAALAKALAGNVALESTATASTTQSTAAEGVNENPPSLGNSSVNKERE